MDEHSYLPFAPSSDSQFLGPDRHILEGGSTQFGPDKKDGFTVYLTQDAVIDLHTGTFNQGSFEAFGLLMGKVCKDAMGYFTVIERVFYARNFDAGTGHVHLSEMEMYKLRLQAIRKHPALEFVGWTHSHERVSKYSDVDYQEQSHWNDSYHVGILTFMDGVRGIGSTWATLYRGPLAQPLRFERDATPILRQSNKLPPFLQQEPEVSSPKLRPQEPVVSQETSTNSPKLRPQEPVLPSNEPSSGNIKKRFSWFVSKKAFFSPFLTLVIVIVGVVLGNFLLLGMQPVVPTSSTTNLLWDCNQQSGKAPLTITCTGPVGSTIQGWNWDLGDGTIMQKSTITHVYQAVGTYKITLIVITSTNQHSGTYNINAGSITIQVAP